MYCIYVQFLHFQSYMRLLRDISITSVLAKIKSTLYFDMETNEGTCARTG